MEGSTTMALPESSAITDEPNVMQPNPSNAGIRLYGWRYVIMGIFVLYSMSNAFQQVQYVIITNVIVEYYEVSEFTVQWTSLIYMVCNIILAVYATWLLDNRGLRDVVLFGASLNACGALLKSLSVRANLFAMSFLGQTMAAVAQSLILETSSKIASVWFGQSEVSTATACGMFGKQLGFAIGFLAPSLIVTGSSLPSTISNSFQSGSSGPSSYAGSNTTVVPRNEYRDEVTHQLGILFTGNAAVCFSILLTAYVVFVDHPPHPPSVARKLSIASAQSEKEKRSRSLAGYNKSRKALFRNAPFVLLLVTYGNNTGVFCAIGLLLNPMILRYRPEAHQEIGIMGLAMIITGVFGYVVVGYLLDKAKFYKWTAFAANAFSVVFLMIFTYTLQLRILWIDYLLISALGFWLTGYLLAGSELAAEIAYPELEAISSALLNVSTQVFGITLTMITAELLKFSAIGGNLFLTAVLLVGTTLTVFIKEDLKRQKANADKIQPISPRMLE